MRNPVMATSEVIGQIEDELRNIRSAKEQVEAIIGSNTALSDSLLALLKSADKVVKQLDKNSTQIVTEIANKVEMLNIKASDLDNYAQKGVSRISKQAALAQTKLEEDVGSLARKLMDSISASTNHSLETVGYELAGYRVLVDDTAKEFADSTSNAIEKQAKLEEDMGNLARKLMDSISASANQSLKTVGNELAGYRVLVDDTAKEFADSTSNAIEKQEEQTTRIVRLVTDIRESQLAIDSKLEELKRLDVVRLFEEISEIHRIESESKTATNKWRVVKLSAYGVCIALEIAILIKLLLM